jgi:hypothetical protein
MSLPVLMFREVPKDIREWDRVLRLHSQWMRTNGTRVFPLDQRFLPQIAVGGKQSVQSVQPLSSTDSGGGLAAIAIASHTVTLGSKSTAYNSGTITGLANSTLYYVYAQDENHEGGAVTYLSTTNPVVAQSDDSNYYVGKITSAAGGGGGTSGGYGGGGGGGGFPLP